MFKDPTPAPISISSDFIIDEAGFGAMVAGTTIACVTTGIIGTPRVRPTESGLSIEDYFADTLDSIILSVIEEFQRREDDALVTGSHTSDVAAPGKPFVDGIDPNFEVDLDGLLRTWKGGPSERDLLAELDLIASLYA